MGTDFIIMMYKSKILIQSNKKSLTTLCPVNISKKLNNVAYDLERLVCEINIKQYKMINWEKYYKYSLFHDNVLISIIVLVYIKLFYLPILWLISFLNHSNNISY